MQEAESNYDGEQALAKVEKETGISPAQQLELVQKHMAYLHEISMKVGEVALEREKTKQHLASAELADRTSQRDYNLANRQLDILEKVLSAHFTERKDIIKGGFRTIDKALQEGNWDAVAKVYGDMSAMIAKSPLAAALELGSKMKSGKIITLDDF